jgi:alpha-galactosidase/6-phospho-beta-glucosidase family protein
MKSPVHRRVRACHPALDPLTSAMLDLRRIRQMVDELFEAEKDYLPQFA